MAGDWVKIYRSMMDSAVWGDEWLVKLWIWCLLKANHTPGNFLGIQIDRGQFVTGRLQGADELRVTQSRWYRGMCRLEQLGQITTEANNRFTIVTVCKYKLYQEGNGDERTTNEQPKRHLDEAQTKTRKIEQQKTDDNGQPAKELRRGHSAKANNERTTNEQQTNTIEEEQEGKKVRKENTLPLSPIGETEAGNRPPTTDETPKRRVKPETSPGFEEWFGIYPRHVAKKPALDSYRKAAAKIPVDQLIAITRAYACAVIGVVPKHKIPYPATWLNQERWTDDPAEWTAGADERPAHGFGHATNPADPRGTFAAGQAWLASKQRAEEAPGDGE